jgi:tetratricopeptide (TPR) repeat protein
VAALVAAVGVTGTFGLTFRNERLATAHSALALGTQSVANRDYGQAVEQLENGWQAVRWIPGQQDLKSALQARLATAHQGRLAAAVHGLAEQLRFLDGLDPPTAAQLERLDAGCQKLWEARERIVAGADSLTDEQRGELYDDLADLAISWGALQLRLAAPAELENRRRDALKLLDEAQAVCGPNLALDLARREFSPQSYAARPLPEPQTAREHFALGRYLLRSNQTEAAARQFQEALRLEPQQFWANFYLTLAAYRLEDYQRALVAASNCVTLSPRSAPCFYNRGLCYEKLEQGEPAHADLSAAIRLDPKLGVAYLHRAAILIGLGKIHDAAADLHRASEFGAAAKDVEEQQARLTQARQAAP